MAVKNCLLFFICLLILSLTNLDAQPKDRSGLWQLINATAGEEKLKNMLLLAEDLAQPYPDSCLIVSAEALKLADSLRSPELEIGRAHV